MPRLGSNRYKQIVMPWKWVIGVDPGKQTGWAVYSVQYRAFDEILTLSFWQVFDEIQKYPISDTKVVIEVPDTNTVWQATPKGLGPLQRQAVNVGRVLREAELLAEGIAKMGYCTLRVNPIGKTDQKRFQRITGFIGRLNQHQRDAGMLCWGGRPTQV